MIKPPFHQIVIFGTGLIGGSFALALRRANAVGEVVGFGRSVATLKQAQQLNIIHRIGADLAAELGTADLVLLATPVGQIPGIMARIAPHLGSHTIVTDAGSTKSDIVKHARVHLAGHISRFIPAHPIAGAEVSGAAAAHADLFQNKKVVITPIPENIADGITRVKLAWELCGSSVSELTARQHDEVFAMISHLPHLLSFALVHELAQRDNRDLLLSFAASGFRDFTRIAASSPEMWRDICLANREALLRELDQYSNGLSVVRAALVAEDEKKLKEIFQHANLVRSSWTPQ